MPFSFQGENQGARDERKGGCAEMWMCHPAHASKFLACKPLLSLQEQLKVSCGRNVHAHGDLNHMEDMVCNAGTLASFLHSCRGHGSLFFQ